VWKTLSPVHPFAPKYLLPSLLSTQHYELTIFSPVPLSSFSILTPYPLFSPLCSLGVQQHELSVGIDFLARSGRPWSHVKGNWGHTAAAPALHLLRRCTHRGSSPASSLPLVVFFSLLHRPSPSLSLVQGYSTAWPDGGVTQRWLWPFMAPRQHDSSRGAGSSR
jgi:hypothetical protein